MNFEQIAKLSGVSRSTVSRVINNDPNVSDATREKMRHADDDLPLAAHTNPPLTTLRQPIHRSGVMAVELLIELIEQPGGAPRRIAVPTELVVRASCGSMMKHDSSTE